MNTHQRMLPQQYCLRWKYHHNNLQVMFSQLLERESFCDVTLACEGRTLRAHKVVLSACSTYFDTIFSQYEEKNPIVILKDVKFADIRALVEFMYRGEINIDHSHLASLLKAAEDLRIKGLAEVSWRSETQANQSVEENVNNTDTRSSQMDTVVSDNEVEPPLKRRRGRPPMDASSPVFHPKVTSVSSVVTNEATFRDRTGTSDAENETSAWDEAENEVINCDTSAEATPAASSESFAEPEEKEKLKPTSYSDGAPVTTTPSSGITSQIAEQYRDVIKLNDYLTTGRRQQFWEEPFTRRIMDAIKSKELEMKTGAELLGVSYGTLYGRYRDAYGCLKHPYRVRDFWSESGPADVLAKVQRKEITLFRAAEMLNVTVTTLANYLSTLRQYEGDESLDDARDHDDMFGDTYKTPVKKFTSALENNPDITIVKQEPPGTMMNHEQIDNDSALPSVGTNDADHSDTKTVGSHLPTNGVDDEGGE
ncbi:protein abrupt isoform X2 [Schistocerca nitens]|uniref:protein abrupt isoform X2 n=1 Tax=Schistocerca nitens TaxID=7011 RepID=UPI002117B403|nr:protein abrupt isoform X2 [Schistocerca nitens]